MTASRAKRIMSQAATGIMLDKRTAFYAFLLGRLKRVEDPDCQTAWTDMTYIGYSPKFIEELYDEDSETVDFVLLHEVYHCANLHPLRRGSRNPKKWNRAADYVTNLDLVNMGFRMPQGKHKGLLDPQYAGMSVERVYELLPDMPGDDGPSDEKGGGNGGALDDLRTPPAAEHAAAIESSWKVATIQAAVIAHKKGSLPDFAKRLVAEAQKPVNDWRSLLARFVQETAKDDYSWRVPNHRYMHMGIYMPGLRSETMPPIVIGVDTSGSIGKQTLSKFASTMQDIIDSVHPERVHILYCDARLHREDIFERDEDIKINPVGGGGTLFTPVFDYIDEQDIQPACLIYLTDMWGDFPDEPPRYPVIWASVTPDYEPPFGQFVYIDEREGGD